VKIAIVGVKIAEVRVKIVFLARKSTI